MALIKSGISNVAWRFECPPVTMQSALMGERYARGLVHEREKILGVNSSITASNEAGLQGTLFVLIFEPSGLLEKLSSLLRQSITRPDIIKPSVDLPMVKPIDVPEASDRDEPGRFAHLSNSPAGVKSNDIWGGFTQGSIGNCSTIAGLKTAIARFSQSPLGIFRRVEAAGGGYKIVMRDGYRLYLKSEEIE